MRHPLCRSNKPFSQLTQGREYLLNSCTDKCSISPIPSYEPRCDGTFIDKIANNKQNISIWNRINSFQRLRGFKGNRLHRHRKARGFELRTCCHIPTKTRRAMKERNCSGCWVRGMDSLED